MYTNSEIKYLNSTGDNRKLEKTMTLKLVQKSPFSKITSPPNTLFQIQFSHSTCSRNNYYNYFQID